MSSAPDGAASSSMVLDQIQAKLTGLGISFSVARHAPVFTSEEAAAVRGTALASGAKALVLMMDGIAAMCVLPADRKLDSRKLRTATSTRSIRFASPDEVLKITGLRPGSIPPFGSLFKLATYCDPAFGENSTINFNAGDHSVSISMSFPDFLLAESPRLLEICAA